MTIQDARAFVDTNVLLRLMMPQLAGHLQAEALMARMWQEGVELWISRQVIREYLVQVTNPVAFSPSLTVQQVMDQIEAIQFLFIVADETQSVTDELLSLLQQYPTRGKQIHDANIVATMLAHEIRTLLTLNVADMKRFTSKITLISPPDLIEESVA